MRIAIGAALLLACAGECERGAERPCVDSLSGVDGAQLCTVADGAAEHWSVCRAPPPCAPLGARRPCACGASAELCVQYCAPTSSSGRGAWGACVPRVGGAPRFTYEHCEGAASCAAGELCTHAGSGADVCSPTCRTDADCPMPYGAFMLTPRCVLASPSFCVLTCAGEGDVCPFASVCRADSTGRNWRCR